MRQGRNGVSRKIRRRSHDGSTMNDSSNNSEDLFLDDDLNNIFVEADEGDPNNNSGVSIRMDDFSNNSIGSSVRGRGRRSSGTSKASKASLSSSSRSLRSRSGLFSTNSLDTNDEANKSKNTEPQSSSGVATRSNKQGRPKSDGSGVRKNDTKISNSVNQNKNNSDRGRADHDDDKPDYDDNDYDADTDVDDDEAMVNNPTRNDDSGIADDKPIQNLSDNNQNASSVSESNNDKNRRQSPNMFKNDDNDSSDVIGAVKAPTWHNEAADKEHRKQMILEM